MLSLTNQQGNSKSLTGLSDDYATNIITNTLEVIDELTLDTGGLLTLPSNSIQDSYLSSNVAFRNQSNNFTLNNTFITQLTTDNSTLCATTAYVKSNLLNYALLNPLTTQVFTGTNTFGVLNANTSTIATNSTRVATTAYVKSNLLNYAVLAPSVAQTFSGENIFDTLRATTPATSTNSTIVSTTQYVKANLLNYALLSPSIAQVYTGSHQFPTQLTTDNSTLCATTAYVQSNLVSYATTASLSSYAQLAGTQTFTGSNTFNTSTNTFNSLTVHNATLRNFQSTQAVFPGDFRMLDSTQTYLTQMYQTGTTCIIDAPFASSRIQFSTRTALNVGLNNLLIENGNHVVLQGSSNEIDITGTAVTLNGVCSFTNAITPTISTAIPTADNSSKIATTSFVKSQGYALTSSLSSYMLLNANQTITGQQTFTAIVPTTPILIKNTVSSNSGGLIVAGASSYNNINNAGDFAVIGFGPTVNNGVLNLTTWANVNACGIKIDANSIKFNAGLSCNYYTLSPVPALNVFDIGYQQIYPSVSWTNWTGFTTPQNVLTINYNGIGGRQLGTFLVEIVFITNNTGTPTSQLIWTTAGPTSDAINDTCCHSSTSGLYGAVTAQIIRMSFILIVDTLPTTYYLNYRRLLGSGSGLSEDKVNSKVTFTRQG